MTMLTKSQITKLRALEDVLTTAKRWQVQEAKALSIIRRERLYRGHHDSFDAYVEERHGYERAHAHRLAAWGDILDVLAPIGGALPLRESHARPLIGLSVEQQREAWKLVQTRLGGTRTAAEIAMVVEAQVNRRRPQTAGVQPVVKATNEVVLGDAAQQVRTLEDATVDLAIFSPPYCEQRRGRYPGIPEHQFPAWITALMTAIKPKLVGRGSVFLITREHVRDGQMTDVILRARLAIRATGWREVDELIWRAADKPPIGRTDRPRRTWERILWFSRTSTPFIDPYACGTVIEDRAQIARPRRHRLSSDGFSGFITNGIARVTDIIEAPVGTIAKGIDHPAMFPESLADRLIRTFSPVGGFVIDPTCGSGTTLLAARAAGRRSWGCDIVPSYVNLARQRLG